jgi:hypothetical protein
MYTRKPKNQHMTDTCWLFSPGTPVSSNNKTDLHDITEILLKVALNTIEPIKLFVYFVGFEYQSNLE